MFSKVASASRRSMEPVAVHSRSYRAFRRRVCSSRSLRDCSAAIVKTVDMDFSFVVLAAPTIGAACGPEVTISKQTAPAWTAGANKGQEREIQPRSFDSEGCGPQRSAKKIPEGS